MNAVNSSLQSKVQTYNFLDSLIIVGIVVVADVHMYGATLVTWNACQRQHVSSRARLISCSKTGWVGLTCGLDIDVDVDRPSIGRNESKAY